MLQRLAVSLLLLATVAVLPAAGQPTVLPGAGDEAPAGDAALVPVAPVPDTLLAGRLQRLFGRIDDFENVRVTVDEGVVSLEGTVLQAAAAERAVELVRRFEGVLYVDNEIEAETDVADRLTPAIGRVEGYVRDALALLPLMGVALLVVLAFWGFARLLREWDAPARRLGIAPLVWSLARRVIRGVIVLIGLLLAFDIMGVSALVGAVLGTAGVFGIAIGFAFQDIVENYLAGALLSIRHSFSVNDLLLVGDQEGRVVRLTARELVLLTAEGNHVQIPNAAVFKSTVVNYSRNPRRMFFFDVGVGVDEDLGRAMEVGVGTLEALRGVLDDPPPFARVRALGDWSVTVRFHGWVNQVEADFFKVQSEAIRLVKTALDEAGVEMPEPIYRVRLRRLGDAEAPPAVRGPSAAEQAGRADVAPDYKLDEQIREDLARPDEENLLESR